MGTAARVIAAGALAVSLASPALAQSVAPPPGATPETSPPDQVVLTGRVFVMRGEAVGEVVVFHGRAQIAGVVHGDVVVLDGPVGVSGQVSGSVVALSGPVTLAATAQVGRDVLGGDAVTVRPGAKVEGSVRQHVRFTLRGWLPALAWLLTWLAVTVSTLLLGLFVLFLAPRGADQVALATPSAPWACIGWGFGALALLPVLSVALLPTVLGLPLGLAVLLALALVLMLAYTLAAYAVGRALVKPPRARVLAFVAGWSILRLIGLVPVVSGITFGVGAAVGLGAITVATWRARGRGGRHRVRVPRAEEPAPAGLA